MTLADRRVVYKIIGTEAAVLGLAVGTVSILGTRGIAAFLFGVLAGIFLTLGYRKP